MSRDPSVKRSATIASVLIALLATACTRRQQSDEAAAIISIVGTNDLHGGVVPREGHGGLALLGGYLSNLRAARARDGGAVLLVDAGDMFQGTLESNVVEGASVVAAYNALGYTAATIGNHEFDFGPIGPAEMPRSPGDDPRGAIKARIAEAHFPILAANLIDESTGQPVAWPNLRPSVMVDAAGFKVGIIGVLTKVALSATRAANIHNLAIAPLAATIQTQATQLRSQGAAVVIVAAHAGARCASIDSPDDLSSCEPATQEIIDVARALPPGLVDHIVAGHVHSVMAYRVNGITLTESYSGGRAFGRVDLTLDRASRHVTGSHVFAPRELCERENPATQTCDADTDRAALVPVVYEGAPIASDPAITAVLQPVIDRVRALKAKAVGIVIDGPIRRDGVESPLGNLVADAFRASVPAADIGLNNTAGGLRTDLPSGPLTYGSLFELMPFDNVLVSLHLTGADLRNVFTQALQRPRVVPGISGVRVRASCSAGELVVTVQRPSGQPIGDHEPLLIATSDFLATGGDGILTPVTPPGGFAVASDGRLARDDLAESLRRRGGRLREADLVDPRNPRWQYPHSPPIDCRTQ